MRITSGLVPLLRSRSGALLQRLYRYPNVQYRNFRKRMNAHAFLPVTRGLARWGSPIPHRPHFHAQLPGHPPGSLAAAWWRSASRLMTSPASASAAAVYPACVFVPACSRAGPRRRRLGDMSMLAERECWARRPDRGARATVPGVPPAGPTGAGGGSPARGGPGKPGWAPAAGRGDSPARPGPGVVTGAPARGREWPRERVLTLRRARARPSGARQSAGLGAPASASSGWQEPPRAVASRSRRFLNPGKEKQRA